MSNKSGQSKVAADKLAKTFRPKTRQTYHADPESPMRAAGAVRPIRTTLCKAN